MPSAATGLGLPHVMGPVGGSLGDPPGFADDTAPWFVRLRGLDRIRMRHDPLLRRTYERADCVIGIAPYVQDFLAGVELRRFEIMSETGLTELPVPGDADRTDGAVRLLYVGRVVRTKGLRDAVRALGRLKTSTRVELDVVGDGFDLAACEALVVELGLGDRVRFHGRQQRERVEDFYRAADVFVFPSYREPGGNVVFESMGYALPLVVTDLRHRQRRRRHLRHSRAPGRPRAVRRRARGRHRPSRRRSRAARGGGAAGRKRVAETAVWDRKVEQLEALYDDVLPAG